MKILVLTPRFPLPTTKGDKLRSWQLIRKLASKHEVILLSYIGPREEIAMLPEVRKICRVETVPFNPFSGAYGVLRGLRSDTPLQVHLFESPKMKKLVAKYLPEVDVVHCSTLRMAGNLPDKMDCKLVIDYIDALSLNFERRTNNAGFPVKAFLQSEFKRLKFFESGLVSRADLALTVSPIDARALGTGVEVVPNSVNLDKYYPPSAPRNPRVIVFTGNMGYTPNVEAAVTMTTCIMPLVVNAEPGARLRLVGINPGARVRSLENEYVTVTGYVPDLAEEIRMASIAVAPLYSGSGLQNKILEAMGCATPVVSTSIANAGVGAIHGEHILIGDSYADFADSVLSLMNDPENARRIGLNGRNFVEERFGWDNTQSQILKLFSRLQPGDEITVN